MKYRPRTSIIIPVYNGSNYLKQAIESALGQSYDNLEVIVVNDGSSDEGATENIATSFGDRIRYLTKDNGGVSTALNMGLRAMTGEWFFWLSHDDLYHPRRVEEDILFLENHQQARVVFGTVIRIDDQGKNLGRVHYPITHVTCPHHSMLLGGPNACSLAIHRSCFEVAGYFNEDNRTTQDVEITIRLATCFEFHHNPHAVVYSREHQQRGTHVLSERQKQDRQVLGQWFYTSMTFNQIFGNIEMSREQQAQAWFWLASVYHYFLCPEYEEECYKKAFSHGCGIRPAWRLKRILRRIQRNPKWEKWVLRLYALHDAILWAKQKPINSERK